MTTVEYFIKRTAQALFTFFAVISITFGMIRLMPGDPIANLKAELAKEFGAGMTEAQLEQKVAIYANMHPDRPIHEQYIDYMTGILTGDFGMSLQRQEPVADILGEALPWTIFISIISLVLIYIIGIVLGALMAYLEGSKLDFSSSTMSIVLTSIPYYMIAVVLVFLLGYYTELFPTGGKVAEFIQVNNSEGLNPTFIMSVFYYGALPIASLVIAGFGRVALSMRGNSIQTLGADYLRVARLRGLSQRRIALRYVARNAFLPMYTGMMIALGTLFGSSIILEYIFTYKGVGYYMYRAVNAGDYPLLMGIFLFITLGVVVGVYIADLTYGFIDPRAGGGGDREAF